MKICLISSDKYPFFLNTANYLSYKGYDVHVFCSKPINNLATGINIHRDLIGKLDAEKNKINVITLPINAYKMRKILSKIKPNILHSFNLKWSGWIAAMSSYHPFILSGLGSDILIEQKAESNLILKILKHYTIHKADLITVVNKQMEKQISQINNKVQIEYFHPGANGNIFKPGTAKASLRKKFKKNERKIIFSPRQIRPIYQIKEIIKAFYKLRKKFNNVFLIQGGSDKTPYVSSVRQLVKKKKLQDSVYFTGRVSSEEWLEYYRVADAIVSYPYNDGMPATIFEAMAIKKPLVLSNIPSTDEVCTNNLDALICEKNDINQLAKAFEIILFDEKLKNKLINNGFVTFKKYGDSEKSLRKLEDIYYQLSRKIV